MFATTVSAAGRGLGARLTLRPCLAKAVAPCRARNVRRAIQTRAAADAESPAPIALAVAAPVAAIGATVLAINNGVISADAIECALCAPFFILGILMSWHSKQSWHIKSK